MSSFKLLDIFSSLAFCGNELAQKLQDSDLESQLRSFKNTRAQALPPRFRFGCSGDGAWILAILKASQMILTCYQG